MSDGADGEPAARTELQRTELQRTEEPPGGWNRPLAETRELAAAHAVKRGLGRVWAFMVLSFGLYGYYWFYVTRKQLDGELAHGRDDAGLHTAGLVVPVLNLFIVHWLWRDLNLLRQRVGLAEFPEIPYLIGSIFLAPLFFSLVVGELNEYWDVRTGGLAGDAPVSAGEKAVVAVGALFLVLWLAAVVVSFIVLIVLALSS